MNPPSAHLQHTAHLADTRAAIGKRHLLYDLERHPLEGCPLTQLFTTLAKRRPSWWSSTQPEDGNAKSPSNAPSPVPGANNTTAVPTNTTTPVNTTAVSQVRSASPATVSGDTANNHEVSSDGRAEDPEDQLPAIPDTVVWENNIPKGWFYYDPKEGHVLRRKVETKTIMSSFLKNAKYADDVVAVMYTSLGQCETGEPALEYHFISAAGLESFLFENGRGKGTSILQAFVPSLHAAHNDTIEAIWSPTMFHVNRRQNIHEIADDRVDLNDRCITFEGKTHLSRLVQCTSRLRQTVKNAVVSFVKHFHETDSKHVITRFVGRFKMNQDSQLIFLNCVSVRIMRAAGPAYGLSSPALAMAQQQRSGSATPSRGLSGDRGNLSFDSGVRAPYTLAAPDGGGSAFYKQYRVCLDLAVHYNRRKPPSLNRGGENRSVLARLQESAEQEREADRREREANRPDSIFTVQDRFETAAAAAVNSRSQGLHRTQTGIDPDEWMDKAAKGSGLGSSAKMTKGGLPPTKKQEPMLGTHKASRHGFVVRPNRQESITNARSGDSFTSFANSPLQQGSVDSAVTALVRSGEFANVVTATAEQQQRVCRVLDKCVRKVGVSSVRRALLQAHESDLTDAERMELLALMLNTDEARIVRTPTPALKSKPDVATTSTASAEAAAAPDPWKAVLGVVDDVGYQVSSTLDGTACSVVFPRCGALSCAAGLLKDIADHLQSRRSSLDSSSGGSSGPPDAPGVVDSTVWQSRVKEILLSQFESDGASNRFTSAHEVAVVVIGVCLVSSASCTSLLSRCSIHRDDATVTLTLNLSSPILATVRKIPLTAVQAGQRIVFAARSFIEAVRHIELRPVDEGISQVASAPTTDRAAAQNEALIPLSEADAAQSPVEVVAPPINQCSDDDEPEDGARQKDTREVTPALHDHPEEAAPTVPSTPTSHNQPTNPEPVTAAVVGANSAETETAPAEAPPSPQRPTSATLDDSGLAYDTDDFEDADG